MSSLTGNLVRLRGGTRRGGHSGARFNAVSAHFGSVSVASILITQPHHFWTARS